MRNRSVTYSTEAAFHALADPTRRAVLDLLRSGSQPAVPSAATPHPEATVDPYLTMAPVLVGADEEDTGLAACIITCSCIDCGGVCGHTSTGASCRCRPTPQGLRCRAS